MMLNFRIFSVSENLEYIVDIYIRWLFATHQTNKLLLFNVIENIITWIWFIGWQQSHGFAHLINQNECGYIRFWTLYYFNGPSLTPFSSTQNVVNYVVEVIIFCFCNAYKILHEWIFDFWPLVFKRACMRNFWLVKKTIIWCLRHWTIVNEWKLFNHNDLQNCVTI